MRTLKLDYIEYYTIIGRETQIGKSCWNVSSVVAFTVRHCFAKNTSPSEQIRLTVKCRGTSAGEPSNVFIPTDSTDDTLPVSVSSEEQIPEDWEDSN